MASASSSESRYVLPYCYDGNNVDKKVCEVLQLVRDKPLPESSRISDVAALKAQYPIFDSRIDTAICEAVFKDLKTISRRTNTDFHQLIEQEVQLLLNIANYFLAIRSVTFVGTRKVYFGVLAMLLGRNISTGGGSTSFVLRCSVLFDVIAKKKSVNEAVGKYFKGNASAVEIGKRKRITDDSETFVAINDESIQSLTVAEDVDYENAVIIPSADLEANNF